MKPKNRIPKQVVLWGGTGQAKVVRPIIEHYGGKVVAVIDDTPGLQPPFSDVELYLGMKGFESWARGKNLLGIGFCIAIGNPHGRVRVSLSEKLKRKGLVPVTVIHPTAWIAENAAIGEGAQIMAGAIIAPEAILGKQCIINTRASVDHEDILGDGVELAPGATLCGDVRIATNGWVCAGAIVLPRIKIGADAIIGAGAVVTRDIPAGVTVVGIPAKPLKKSKRSA